MFNSHQPVLFLKALMDLLDKVQLSYDVSDEDVKDITDGEWPMNFTWIKYPS